MTHSIYINKGWGSRRHYVSTTSDASGSSIATFESFTRSWRCRGKVDFEGKPSCVTVVPCASNAECRKSRFTRRRPCQVLLKKTLCHGHHIMREAPKTLEMSFWVTCSSALMLQISASEALQSFANVMDMSVCRFWKCSGHHSLTKRLRHALFLTRAMHFLFI